MKNSNTIFIISKNQFIEKEVALPLNRAGYTTVSVPYEKVDRLLEFTKEPSVVITGTEDPRVLTALWKRFRGTNMCIYRPDGSAQCGEQILPISKRFTLPYGYLAQNPVMVVNRIINGS